MKVVLSPEAEQDLIEACAFIARDGPAAAQRFLDHFREACGHLASGLIGGRDVVLSDGRTVRAWALWPYRLYYRRTADAIEILRLYHQSQRPIER